MSVAESFDLVMRLLRTMLSVPFLAIAWVLFQASDALCAMAIWLMGPEGE